MLACLPAWGCVGDCFLIIYESGYMGKKAVGYLFENLLAAGTVALLAVSAVSAFATRFDPGDYEIFLFAALALPAVLVLDVVAFVYWCIRKRWIMALFPVVSLAMNYGFIGAMCRLPGNSSDDILCADGGFTIAAYNVHGFRSRESFPASVREIAAFVREEGADIVCLEEFVTHHKFGIEDIAAVFSHLPYVLYKGNGVAVFSRYPVVGGSYIKFRDTDNNAIRAVIDVNGKRIAVFAVHLQTTGTSPEKRRMERELKSGDTSAGMDTAVRMWDALKINAAIRARQVRWIRDAAIKEDIPVIVCGDFNDTPASYTYGVMDGSFTDGFKSAGSGYGATYRGFGNMLRIDYIFYGKGIEGVGFRSPDMPMSDHRPVIMRMCFTDARK